MKRTIFLAAALCMMLTSCGDVSGNNTAKGTDSSTAVTEGSVNDTTEPASGTILGSLFSRNSPRGSDSQAEISNTDMDRLQNAKTVSEVKDLMHRTESNLKYSEVDTDELDYYFDLFCSVPDKYIITEYQGKKYILFNYVYSGYGVKMDEVTNIEKTYNGNTLDLHVTAKTHTYESIGCEPDMTYCRCILELDNDIDMLTFDGRVEYNAYSKYDGGILYVGDICGVSDGEFNIIVPVRYEMIRKYDVYGYGAADKIAEYYYIFDENGGGLMDKDFNILIETGYRNINYISDDKFAAMPERTEGSLEESRIVLINSKGELLREPVEGFIDGNGRGFTGNYAHQVVFGRMNGNDYLHGVLDEDLNEVIPPIYKEVEPFSEDTPNQFYVVQNKDGKCAVAGIDGELKTDFLYNEIYDCWTDYEDNYIRPREYKE